MLFRQIALGDLVSQDELFGPNIYFADSGDKVGKPVPFSPEIASSKQMQSEHMTADDAPVDVNLNAVLAREQGAAIASHGKATSSNTDRREKLADAGAGIFAVS